LGHFEKQNKEETEERQKMNTELKSVFEKEMINVQETKRVFQEMLAENEALSKEDLTNKFDGGIQMFEGEKGRAADWDSKPRMISLKQVRDMVYGCLQWS